MRIGIDLDDVLFDFYKALYDWYNKKYGTNYKKSDIKDLTPGIVWKCSIEEASKIIYEFYYTKEHDVAEAVEGSKKAIEKLKQNHELFIITSRPQSVHETTKRWIDKNFPETFKEIRFATSDVKEYFKGKKFEIAKEMNIEFFIDDLPENVFNVSKLGIPVTMFDEPWNQEAEIAVSQNVKRAKTWDEIVKEIEKSL